MSPWGLGLALTVFVCGNPPCPHASAQAIHQTSDFQLTLPSGWTARALPGLGKAPHDLRRWELTAPTRIQGATFDVEVDRTENLGRFPIKEARARAEHLARKLSYQNYQQRELTLKGAPGFYETWTAQVPNRPKFRVFAARTFYRGAHIRIAAVESPASVSGRVEAELHQLLSRWRWKP